MKKLQQIIDYFKNIDPCSKESTCVVRPACYILQSTPWERWRKCPDYETYCDRRDKFIEIKSKIVDWFWIIIILSVFMIIVIIFGLGVWKLIELIQTLVSLK